MKGHKLLTVEQVADIEALLGIGVSHRDVARTLGVDSSTVSTVAHGRHFHQQTEEEKSRRQNSTLRNWTPTPEEIREACDRFLRLRPRHPVGYEVYRFDLASPYRFAVV